MVKAFPEVKYVKSGEFGSHVMAIEGGMNLRDYFAAKAMTKVNWFKAEEAAKTCYEMADAMMKARGRHDKET